MLTGDTAAAVVAPVALDVVASVVGVAGAIPHRLLRRRFVAGTEAATVGFGVAAAAGAAT